MRNKLKEASGKMKTWQFVLLVIGAVLLWLIFKTAVLIVKIAFWCCFGWIIYLNPSTRKEMQRRAKKKKEVKKGAK